MACDTFFFICFNWICILLSASFWGIGTAMRSPDFKLRSNADLSIDAASDVELMTHGELKPEVLV